jgi:hypothetical protein
MISSFNIGDVIMFDIKRILTVLMVLIATMSLVACSTTDEEEAPAEEAPNTLGDGDNKADPGPG